MNYQSAKAGGVSDYGKIKETVFIFDNSVILNILCLYE